MNHFQDLILSNETFRKCNSGVSQEEKGIYIISSHDIECLQNVCDKCLLLHNGQIREINMEEVDREEIAKILSEGE